MTDVHNNDSNTEELTSNTATRRSNWGARLFFGTLFALLAFFWWLLIYSGGVAGHHG